LSLLLFGTIEEEILCEHHGGNAEDAEFDAIVGALEELLVDDRFQEIQTRFGEKHCGKSLICYRLSVSH
jgi:hypothetical protein